ncbi:NAD(P)H-quinone oxidoreductase subunit K, chloroplastic [Nocardioides aquaticus]|uniref:NAD(P)H-quinone oxidoreductase subunit K, chloroplastic n=1 Tax=Nocardioides aquaticus TaxID=160826 RepID=A0ABX8EJT1_9ACTN|nr:hypothetical protein [Nocardioides aquaticus]QVT79352.1 NAD(P)H-quinone oxidoreductase subunit K, chloroplastic [Nocardioides aquaticus]
MGLIEVLTRAAAARAHVLVAEVPGAFEERVALERALERMGWCIAESAADADVLAVVGAPDEALTAVADHVWAQMSEPRVRVHLHADSEAAALLNEARERLRLGARRLTGPDVRRGFTPSADAMAPEHDDQDGAAEHGDHHDHDGGHDHSAMMPDGIPLAEGAEDRDGLEMDELHLPLGPVLAHWPAGIVLRVTLHGDVVVGAEVEQLATSRAGQPDDPVVRAARLLDAAGSVLALAGLPAESARVRRLRDRCLDGELHDGHEVAQLGDRLGRRRVLRWILSGLIAEGSHGGSEELHDRLTALFEQARAELDGDAVRPVAPVVRALPALVRGMELAEVRLWVAALGPDLAPGLADHVMPEAAHG